MGLAEYDAWLEKPYQDQCAWQEAVEREIDEYRSEDGFINDARQWAVSKGWNPDEIEFLWDEYLESDECWVLCEERAKERKGDEY